MANLTFKNVPEELYGQLKRSAAQHRRSLNSEVIVCLEKALCSRLIDPEAFLAEVRAHRKSIPGVFVTDEFLRSAKNEGRL